MKQLESSIENAVVNYAKQKGIKLARKMNGMGVRSWPDRMLLYKGCVLFIEFKRPGEVPTPKQAAFHKVLYKEGFSVYVVSDVKWGKLIIDNFLVDPRTATDRNKMLTTSH